MVWVHGSSLSSCYAAKPFTTATPVELEVETLEVELQTGFYRIKSVGKHLVDLMNKVSPGQLTSFRAFLGAGGMCAVGV